MLDTILDFVSSISWPIVTIIVALIFKSEISRLFLRLSNLKYKDLELTFDQDLKKAEASASRLNLSPPDRINEIPDIREASPHHVLLQLADTYPEAAVMEAWRIVEIELTSTAKSLNIDAPQWSPMRIVSTLTRMQKIDPSTSNLLQELRQMRNSVAHHGDVPITSEQATRYIELALSLASSLKKLIKL